MAYELGLLALSAELPAILVRGLRQADVSAGTAGWPSCRTARGTPPSSWPPCTPQWRAPRTPACSSSGPDAEQLAGWAMLLLSRTLPRPRGASCASPRTRRAAHRERFDLALIYHPAPWLDDPATARRAMAPRTTSCM